MERVHQGLEVHQKRELTRVNQWTSYTRIWEVYQGRGCTRFWGSITERVHRDLQGQSVAIVHQGLGCPSMARVH